MRKRRSSPITLARLFAAMASFAVAAGLARFGYERLFVQHEPGLLFVGYVLGVLAFTGGAVGMIFGRFFTGAFIAVCVVLLALTLYTNLFGPLYLFSIEY